MNIKFLLAVVASLIIGFIVGGLLYAVLFADFFNSMSAGIPEGVMKNPPDMIGIILANLTQSILVTWIFLITNTKTLKSGLIKGMIIGVLMALTFDFFMMASMEMMTMKYFVVDVICSTVVCSFVGMTSAFILGFEKK